MLSQFVVDINDIGSDTLIKIRYLVIHKKKVEHFDGYCFRLPRNFPKDSSSVLALLNLLDSIATLL